MDEIITVRMGTLRPIMAPRDFHFTRRSAQSLLDRLAEQETFMRYAVESDATFLRNAYIEVRSDNMTFSLFFRTALDVIEQLRSALS